MEQKKKDDEKGLVFRLFNNSMNSNSTILSVNGEQVEKRFGKFEVKTVIYNDLVFVITDDLIS